MLIVGASTIKHSIKYNTHNSKYKTKIPRMSYSQVIYYGALVTMDNSGFKDLIKTCCSEWHYLHNYRVTQEVLDFQCLNYSTTAAKISLTYKSANMWWKCLQSVEYISMSCYTHTTHYALPETQHEEEQVS
jgi:hypothetical protein